MDMFPLAGSTGTLTGIASRGPDVADDALPLVLLHGIQGTARSWEGVIAKVADTAPAVAPNLRGRAGSPSPDDPSAYSIDAFAEDLAAVIDAVGRPVVLAGWSMGTLVALAYIRARGLAQLGGLALISGSPHPGRKGANWFAGETVEAIAAAADERARRMGLTESATPVAVAGAWLSCRETDHSGVLPGIHCPVTVIHGTDDDQCPLSHGEFMAQAVPDGELVSLAGRSHSILGEAPDEVARALLELRERCRAAG